jgi:hypothetical protein
MLVARGRIEGNQAILKIGLQPLVPEAIGVSPSQAPVPVPIREYRALIDTGAQRTCLTRETIGNEALKPHGKRPIQNVHDVNIHYKFWVNLGFWCESSQPSQPRDTHRTYYALPEPVEVIDIASNYWFDALIGMDVLRRFDLIIERTGEFELRLN